MSDSQIDVKRGFDAELEKMKAEDNEKETSYIYVLYDPAGDEFVYIGRSAIGSYTGVLRLRELDHLTKNKKSRDYKQDIQDLLASTGLKICRPFTGLKHITAQNYEAAMILSQDGALNKAGGTFRGSFLGLTGAQRLEIGKHLVEKAKQFCRDDQLPIYTTKNIKSFKPSYIPIIGVCSGCNEKKEFDQSSFCVACMTKRRKAQIRQKHNLKFCKGAANCPGLGLVKKLPMKSIGDQLCDTCNRRKNQEKKNREQKKRQISKPKVDDPKFKPVAGDSETFPFDGDTIECDYILLDSSHRRLASSYYKRRTLKFVVGQEQVLPGFEDGVLQMTLGEKKEFVVGSDRAFGPNGFAGLIPGDADLIFQVHLISIGEPKSEEADGDENEVFQTPNPYFCKGHTYCSKLGLVKKVHLPGTPRLMCEICKKREVKQEERKNEGKKTNAKRKPNDPKFKPKAGDLQTFPVAGDIVRCDYILLDSSHRRLASSYYHKKQLDFVVGQEQVLPGFEDGVLQMTLGEKKEFVVGSDRAFGPNGFAGLIPGDADLIFQVHLISIGEPKSEEADGDEVGEPELDMET